VLFPTSIRSVIAAVSTTFCVLILSATTNAQSTVSTQGEVTDQNGAVVPAAEVTVRGEAIGIDLKTTTDSGARYLIAALPTGESGSSRQIQFALRFIFQAIL